jgi:hypothetical protein
MATTELLSASIRSKLEASSSGYSYLLRKKFSINAEGFQNCRLITQQVCKTPEQPLEFIPFFASEGIYRNMPHYHFMQLFALSDTAYTAMSETNVVVKAIFAGQDFKVA